MLIKTHELLHKSKFEVLDEIYKNLTKPVMGRNNILHTPDFSSEISKYLWTK